MPTVSIVVPNYNHERYLPRRLDTIVGQTYQDWELILLDDCSTDNSRSILSQYATDPRVRTEFNEVNSGSTFKQWNKGVRLSRGKYVWIAESDDYSDERFLERVVGTLDSVPAVTFAYCQSWQVTADGQLDGLADFYFGYLDQHRWKKDFCVDGREECRNYLVSSNTVPNASAVVFRKDVYESVGGADEGLRICGDWKLWSAMALAGQIAYVGEPLNYYRSHDASVRSKGRKEGVEVMEALHAIRWIMERVTPSDSVIKRLCQRQSGLWVPAVLSTSVPFQSKLTILKDVWAIDPRPIRRAVRPALRTIRRELARVFDRS